MSRLTVFTVSVVLAVAGCSKSAEPTPPPTPTPTAKAVAKDPAAAKRLIAAGATVIDVRTTDEYTGGHLEKATNIPVQQFADRLAEVDTLVGGDKSKPVVLYCAAGGRAGKAKAQLEAAGYTQVVNGGGFDDLR